MPHALVFFPPAQLLRDLQALKECCAAPDGAPDLPALVEGLRARDYAARLRQAGPREAPRQGSPVERRWVVFCVCFCW